MATIRIEDLRQVSREEWQAERALALAIQIQETRRSAAREANQRERESLARLADPDWGAAITNRTFRHHGKEHVS